MSGPPPSSAGNVPRSTSNGGVNGIMAMPPQLRPGEGVLGGSAVGSGQNGALSQQNLNQIAKEQESPAVHSEAKSDTGKVSEYLAKKGYSRTEAMFRTESANQEPEGRPNITKSEDPDLKYGRAFKLLEKWIEENLDIYKTDLRRLLWPVFVYSFLELNYDNQGTAGQKFFNAYKQKFEDEHVDDLRALGPINRQASVLENPIAQIYRGNKYRLSMHTVAFHNLIQFLEARDKEGGAVIVYILQTHLHIVAYERTVGGEHSMARMLGLAQADEDFPTEDEGIPGHNPGSANVDRSAGSNVMTKLKLGPLPMEPELLGDVRVELEEEDAKHPAAEGQISFLEHFEQHIKREESEDAPSRLDLPLPASTARDVTVEVQKVKENRDRFKIESRTGGVGPNVSVVMNTFHNTYESINCLDISQDSLLIATGTADSYIRVWSLQGKPLVSTLPHEQGTQAPNSRRLVGHSGPVFAVSFSPSIAPNDSVPLGYSKVIPTNTQALLSCSADKTIRLWSLDSWQCLVVYKGHDGMIWDITWGPYGHYFLTGSRDRTARLWSTESIAYLRLFVGHDQDVDVVAFHPNSAYVFTGSCDKTVRMYAVTNGYPVRMFTGHTGNVISLACSPSGKILASADDAGTIILWDLAPGRLLKRMRGHGKGGIWSLSFSAESTVLVSGGADGTVRVWDVVLPAEAPEQGKILKEVMGAKIDAGGQNGAGVVSGAGGAKKKKGKEVVVTPDQISAFPTKKSPVYKVRFTGMNLVVAAGAYLP